MKDESFVRLTNNYKYRKLSYKKRKLERYGQDKRCNSMKYYERCRYNMNKTSSISSIGYDLDQRHIYYHINLEKEKIPFVLWFSQHEMTEDQKYALSLKYGNEQNAGGIYIKQINKTVSSMYEIQEQIKAADIIAMVGTPEMQAQALEIANGKPVLTAVSDRVLVKDPDGGESKAEFVFNRWEKVNKIEINKEKYNAISDEPKKVLWFSRHEMTAEQKADLNLPEGSEIIQVDKTIKSASEIKDEINAADIVAVVAPIELQKEFLELANGKPVLTGVNQRIPQENKKFQFKHDHWDQVNSIVIDKTPVITKKIMEKLRQDIIYDAKKRRYNGKFKKYLHKMKNLERKKTKEEFKLAVNDKKIKKICREMNKEHVTKDVINKSLGAILLSGEEYFKYKNNIPRIENEWWLRSRCPNGYHALNVMKNGEYGYVVSSNKAHDDGVGVRPALQISNINIVEVGDKVKFGDNTFTVISPEYALCDEIIEKRAFWEDSKIERVYHAEDVNIYETSDVKKFIDDWFEKTREREKTKNKEFGEFNLVNYKDIKRELERAVERNPKFNTKAELLKRIPAIHGCLSKTH